MYIKKVFCLSSSNRPDTEEEQEVCSNLKKRIAGRKEELRCMLSSLPRDNGYELNIS